MHMAEMFSWRLSQDLVEVAPDRDAANAAPTSTTLAEDLNRNTQFRAGLDDLLVE